MKWGDEKHLLNYIYQAWKIALELFLFLFTYGRKKLSPGANIWRPRVAEGVKWILRIYVVLIVIFPLYIFLDTVKTARCYPDADVTIYATPLIVPTVTTDGGATNIAETEARLRGEVTDTGNENPEVWVFWGSSDGGTDPGSWSDNSNLGMLGLGTFYKDISGLTANTTYYYQCRATNAAGTDWAASSANFTTLPTGSVIGAPSGFTAVDMGAISVNLTWTKGTSGNYTMIRCSREDYPASITEGELIYYGDDTNYISIGYALDPTEYHFSAWGFWTDNSTYSSTYARAKVGGDLMLDIAEAINDMTGALSSFRILMILAIIAPLVFFTWLTIKIDSEWGSPILAIVTGGLSFMLGHNAPNIIDGSYQTSAYGLTLAVVLIIYSLICVAWAWGMMFRGRLRG